MIIYNFSSLETPLLVLNCHSMLGEAFFNRLHYVPKPINADKFVSR